jgi:tetratricopeptide (TPR) repeat protein
MLAHQQRQYDQAMLAYRQLLVGKQDRHFSSIDPSILGFKAHHNLAVVYRDLGRHDLAELEWREIVNEMPDYRPGRHGLVESLLKLGRYETAQVEIDRLVISETHRCLGLVLAAELAEQRGELLLAKKILEATSCDSLDDHEPLEALCRFLFEHGPLDEAKEALQRLVDRLPGDGAAWHNLGAVNTRLGDIAAAVDAYQASLKVRPASDVTSRELSCALAALHRVGDSTESLSTPEPLAGAHSCPAVSDT